jgi:TonB family protein
MKHLVSTLALLFTCAAAPLMAQQDTLIRYFDHKFREVAPPDASDTALTIRSTVPEGGFIEQDFYLSNGKIMRRSYFSDAARTTRIGPYETFYRNGKRKSKGQYVNGLRTGTWRGWDDEGQLSDSVLFNDKGNMTGLRISSQEAFSKIDSIWYSEDGSGKGICRGRYPSGIIAYTGPMLNDQYEGEWTFYHRSGQLAAKEFYQADSMVRASCFDEKGNPVPGKCVAEVEADYPGGTPEWSAFVVKKMESHYKTLVKKGANGNAVVQFVVDTTGTVTDVSLHKATGTYLDEYALKLIRESPKWKPARLHNITVKAYRRQPITFYLED